MSTHINPPHTQIPTTEKSHPVLNLCLWLLQMGTAVIFLTAAYAKLSSEPLMIEVFDTVGFGQWFRYVTGGIEALGAVLLLVPGFAAVGALLLMCVMIGAVMAHLFILGGDPVPAIILLVVSIFIFWGRREQVIHSSRRG